MTLKSLTISCLTCSFLPYDPHSDLAHRLLLFKNRSWSHLLDGLITELDVLLKVGGVLNLQPDDWRRDDQRYGTDGPLR